MLEGLLPRTIWKGTTERSGTVKIKTLLVIRANFNQSGAVVNKTHVWKHVIKKTFSIDLCSSFYDINLPVLIEQSTFHIQTTCSCQEFVKDHGLVQPEVHSLNPGKMDSQDHMIKWFGKSSCYAGRKLVQMSRKTILWSNQQFLSLYWRSIFSALWDIEAFVATFKARTVFFFPSTDLGCFDHIVLSFAV